MVTGTPDAIISRAFTYLSHGVIPPTVGMERTDQLLASLQTHREHLVKQEAAQKIAQEKASLLSLLPENFPAALSKLWEAVLGRHGLPAVPVTLLSDTFLEASEMYSALYKACVYTVGGRTMYLLSSLRAKA